MLITADRFWAKVRRGNDTDCWLWQGCTDGHFGYGAFSIKGKTWHAHQVAWMLTNGAIPKGMVIRHTCDVPLCCNPSHLLVGTHADNVRDRLERRGDQKGEHNYSSKLTDAQVSDIRAKAFSGVAQKDLSKEYGVSSGIVSLIVNGKAWTHTFDPALVPIKKRKLSREQVREIRSRYANNELGTAKLAREYGVSQSLIYKVIKDY